MISKGKQTFISHFEMISFRFVSYSLFLLISYFLFLSLIIILLNLFHWNVRNNGEFLYITKYYLQYTIYLIYVYAHHLILLSKVYIDHWQHAISHETQYDRYKTYEIRPHCSMQGDSIFGLVLRVHCTNWKYRVQ